MINDGLQFINHDHSFNFGIGFVGSYFVSRLASWGQDAGSKD